MQSRMTLTAGSHGTLTSRSSSARSTASPLPSLRARARITLDHKAYSKPRRVTEGNRDQWRASSSGPTLAFWHENEHGAPYFARSAFVRVYLAWQPPPAPIRLRFYLELGKGLLVGAYGQTQPRGAIRRHRLGNAPTEPPPLLGAGGTTGPGAERSSGGSRPTGRSTSQRNSASTSSTQASGNAQPTRFVRVHSTRRLRRALARLGVSPVLPMPPSPARPAAPIVLDHAAAHSRNLYPVMPDRARSTRAPKQLGDDSEQPHDRANDHSPTRAQASASYSPPDSST